MNQPWGYSGRPQLTLPVFPPLSFSAKILSHRGQLQPSFPLPFQGLLHENMLRQGEGGVSGDEGPVNQGDAVEQEENLIKRV